MPPDPLEENRLCVSAAGLRVGFLSLPPGLLGIYGTYTAESLPTFPRVCVSTCVWCFPSRLLFLCVFVFVSV